jgi:phospholipase/lecithinase/hemolysin
MITNRLFAGALFAATALTAAAPASAQRIDRIVVFGDS